MRRHGVGNHPAAAVAPASRAGVAEPWARAQVSERCETGTGARASCSLEGLRRPASRSRTREPGASGLPEIRGWSRTMSYRRGADGSPAGPATEWGGWVQVKLQLSRIALGSAVTLSLVGGSLLAAPEAMAQCVTGYDDKGEPILAPAAVMITGGTITNETVIDITADAGTSISDASGGNNNLATTGWWQWRRRGRHRVLRQRWRGDLVGRRRRGLDPGHQLRWQRRQCHLGRRHHLRAVHAAGSREAEKPKDARRRRPRARRRSWRCRIPASASAMPRRSSR